jgi:hypothetical protein
MNDKWLGGEMKGKEWTDWNREETSQTMDETRDKSNWYWTMAVVLKLQGMCVETYC